VVLDELTPWGQHVASIPVPANRQYTNSTPAAQPTAGLEKWVFTTATQQWTLADTLQAGLNLGQPYTVPGYPTACRP
jgi:hypothetical protein